jgi:hypothetical protein
MLHYNQIVKLKNPFEIKKKLMKFLFNLFPSCQTTKNFLKQREREREGEKEGEREGEREKKKEKEGERGEKGGRADPLFRGQFCKTFYSGNYYHRVVSY